MRDFFFLRLVAFKLVFAPSRGEIEPTLLEISLTTLGEVPKSVSRVSRAAIAIISDQLVF